MYFCCILQLSFTYIVDRLAVFYSVNNTHVLMLLPFFGVNLQELQWFTGVFLGKLKIKNG